MFRWKFQVMFDAARVAWVVEFLTGTIPAGFSFCGGECVMLYLQRGQGTNVGRWHCGSFTYQDLESIRNHL
ncbi:hypothetical protein MYCSP_11485 [Mycobacteroides saopaulense]|nr:hypothetical protein MYCSP_11485 [Mycobacteroides saopaulense]